LGFMGLFIVIDLGGHLVHGLRAGREEEAE
jgi:hypothetical protein